MEESQPDQEQPEPEKKKRLKVRSGKLLLMETIQELSDAANDKSMKSNKRVDSLLRKADLVTELARINTAEESDEALVENTELKEKAKQDAALAEQARAEIASLQSTVESLKASQNPVRVDYIPDDRVPGLQNTISTLQGKVQKLEAELHGYDTFIRRLDGLNQETKYRIAIRALVRGNESACQSFCTAWNLDRQSVYLTMQEGDGDALLDILAKNTNKNTPRVFVLKAILTEKYGFTDFSRVRSAVTPIRQEGDLF